MSHLMPCNGPLRTATLVYLKDNSLKEHYYKRVPGE